MTKELHVRAKLRGITPLMMAKMGEDVLENVLIRGDRPRKAPDRPLEDMAADCLYTGPNGELGIPAENLFASLVEAGTLIKFDTKRSISTRDASLMPSFLSIQETFLPLTNLVDVQDPKSTSGATRPWVVDIRRGQLSDGTAVAIVRPKFNTWGLEVNLSLDLTDTPMTEDKVRDLVKKAGRAKGLCSFRPGCKGPFGQFEIESWEVVSNGKK